MDLKRGNYATLQITVRDSSGALVTNLATATEVYFMIKENWDDTNASALVSKSLSDGVSVDTPSTGIVTVLIETPDTASIDPGTYYMALQIEYSADNQQEPNLVENSTVINKITLTEDIIRS